MTKMNAKTKTPHLAIFAIALVACIGQMSFAVQPQPDDAASRIDPVRRDIHISGVYPHLTAYGIYSQNGGHYKPGHDECGIGAIVPWANQLWMVNYAPHQPKGSEHKLYSIDSELKLTVHPESVGGTPAGRMIHAESKQLLIAHYLIDEAGKVRVIPIKTMPMRVTAIARHLSDPANLVYYIDMEGALWEANVHTLEVKQLFKKPVPGWHSKGGYTSQGRLVISNNGELHVGGYDDLLVGGPAKNSEERGVLAEFDGKDWKIIERRQYTEVTGPRGIAGGSDGNDPLWTMGWDRRSVRLKLLDQGAWHTYLLPKAAMCNDAYHGWYTEWPRIREITDGRWMMDMHGMFFDFPKTFSASNSAGIKPIGSHLRYVPDFCAWKDQLVLASDETSIQSNALAGQPQTNLWFGTYDDLKSWGPASGYGGPWIDDHVAANTPSDPFLVAGFNRRVLHLALGRQKSVDSVKFTLQIDRQGNGHWADYESIEVPGDGYVNHLFPADFNATWLRLIVNRDCIATAIIDQTTSRFADPAAGRELFAGLAEVDATDAHAALVYPAKRNRNLQVIASDGKQYEFTKAGFVFQPSDADPKLAELLSIDPEYTVDDASVVLTHRGNRLRLPKGNATFDKPFASGWPRANREVESERHLANIHGTFYEVPLVINGEPPAFNLMRPVASHNKQISDYCSWNGLLVLAGVSSKAKPDGHVFSDSSHNISLWFGGIDDLWKFGKPVGHGGPWTNTTINKGVPSDAYLMRGYDHKTLSLSHTSAHSIGFQVEVDITGEGHWHQYKTLTVNAGQRATYEFPATFSAAWVRLVSEADTIATGQFIYD